MELKALTNHCSAKHVKQAMVSKSMAVGRVCLGGCLYEGSLDRCLNVLETELYTQT